ncbi:hypothetical protein ABPG72_019477 [Tetrahymena utriculariae]
MFLMCSIELQRCQQNLSVCGICNQNNYLFEGLCKENQLYGSYSEEANKMCQKCYNDKCQECNQDLQTCTKCPKEHYLYNGQCYQSQPKYTFCDLKKECQKYVEVFNGQTCDSDLKSCLKYENNYLFEQKCFEKQPEQTYCDDQKNCLKCLNINCFTCDKKLQICTAFQSQQFLHDNNCYQKNQKKLIVMKINIVKTALRVNVNFVMKAKLNVNLAKVIIINYKNSAMRNKYQILFVIDKKFVRNVKMKNVRLAIHYYKNVQLAAMNNIFLKITSLVQNLIMLIAIQIKNVSNAQIICVYHVIFIQLLVLQAKVFTISIINNVIESQPDNTFCDNQKQCKLVIKKIV